jgi:hypothetical protein
MKTRESALSRDHGIKSREYTVTPHGV